MPTAFQPAARPQNDAGRRPGVGAPPAGAVAAWRPAGGSGCPERDSNPHALRARVFKTHASTDFAIRAPHPLPVARVA